jgi:hypothetical protein
MYKNIMSYRVLKFSPKYSDSNAETILWKAQLNRPDDYQSVNTAMLEDNIAVNNRRKHSEWEKLLIENGFKFELNFNHEFAKEYIVFDVNFASYSFELFACDIHVANYDVECTEDHIMTLLFLLDLKKNGTINPYTLMNKINIADSRLVLDALPNSTSNVMSRLLKKLEKLVDHCTDYETDILFAVNE